MIGEKFLNTKLDPNYAGWAPELEKDILQVVLACEQNVWHMITESIRNIVLQEEIASKNNYAL